MDERIKTIHATIIDQTLKENGLSVEYMEYIQEVDLQSRILANRIPTMTSEELAALNKHLDDVNAEIFKSKYKMSVEEVSYDKSSFKFEIFFVLLLLSEIALSIMIFFVSPVYILHSISTLDWSTCCFIIVWIILIYFYVR